MSAHAVAATPVVTERNPSQSYYDRILVMGLVMGVVADRLFFDLPPGVSVLLFLLLTHGPIFSGGGRHWRTIRP